EVLEGLGEAALAFEHVPEPEMGLDALGRRRVARRDERLEGRALDEAPDAREQVVRARQLRREHGRAAPVLGRRLELALDLVHAPEVDARLGLDAAQRERALEGRARFLRAPLVEQRLPEVVGERARARLERAGALELDDRRRALARGVQRVPEV